MDPILSWLTSKLPTEISDLVKQHVSWLQQGEFIAILTSAEAQALFGKSAEDDEKLIFDTALPWSDFVFNRLNAVLSDRSQLDQQIIVFSIGYAALLMFMQVSVTGPPIEHDAAAIVFREHVVATASTLADVRQALLSSLNVDGMAVYPLLQNVELLCLADTIFSAPAILKTIAPARWAKMRVTFVHQRLLSELSSTLQEMLYKDLASIEAEGFDQFSTAESHDAKVEFLLERAVIHLHHGMDKHAREDIERAATLHHFVYQLTGRLGKRTKFQQHDVSQLVVLAKSAARGVDPQREKHTGDIGSDLPEPASQEEAPKSSVNAIPAALDLNDDTLLERISFSQPTDDHNERDETLQPELADLDISDQPQLEPLDSIVLLSLASAITNTFPEHGLTREEMLPYAVRVLEGGSSNWQIYTQALLVRSRIEGYRSRTVERGLLQLQALVDQVIAETTNQGITPETAMNGSTSTFLPRPNKDESAPVMERLRYIFQLASPTRWSMEAELAARWVQLGGLRSALDMYERLQMWAEAALCLAATEQEDKARNLVRKQLFHATSANPENPEKENWQGDEREPLPADAARLFCILGDIDQDIQMYERAWSVSGQRYARAQRSIGRYYLGQRSFSLAADAYSKSLRVNQLNQQSWFALGCALIEMERFEQAAEAFSRCVQLDETDAEAWSNMAAALLRIDEFDESKGVSSREQAHRNRVNALKAFQRAASLKHDSYRIWQNVLVTAASLIPPDYNAILAAQKRVIELRGGMDGEKCIDVDILSRLIQQVIETADEYDPEVPGIARMCVRFVDESVVPLITGSDELWQLISRLAVWRGKLKTALEAEEKAWRAVTSRPGWESQSEARWDEVVDATIRLCDSYESLGPREQTEGLAAGSGELVAKDWRFKARSAARSVANKGRSTWESTKGWERLQEAQNNLKG